MLKISNLQTVQYTRKNCKRTIVCIHPIIVGITLVYFVEEMKWTTIHVNR